MVVSSLTTISSFSLSTRPSRVKATRTRVLGPWVGVGVSPSSTSTAQHRHLVVHRAQWLENSAQVEVESPVEVAWSMWEDRETIPTWMPWITSVEIQEDNRQMSKWTLSTYQFNRQWEFSWLARNMTPLQYQKIHWRSVPGSTSGSLGSIEIQNQGQIRFLRKGKDRCAVKLTISYQVPSALAPFANLLTPVVEGILQQDMERFATLAKQNSQQQ